jgi:protein-tyrosine phosphatase
MTRLYKLLKIFSDVNAFTLMSKPDNFSFVDDHIAGSSIPISTDHLQFFIDEQIKHVISLTPQRPLAFLYLDSDELINHHLAIYSAPSKNIIDQFLEIVQDAMSKGEKMVVHCQFGQERTAMMLAIYLTEIQKYNTLDAMEIVREKRPRSLQTYAAVTFIREYHRRR